MAHVTNLYGLYFKFEEGKSSERLRMAIERILRLLRASGSCSLGRGYVSEVPHVRLVAIPGQELHGASTSSGNAVGAAIMP